jgi:hypothetical protein
MASHSDAVWGKIRTTIAPGNTIQNWSAAKGYTGGAFQIDAVDGSSVCVSGGAMRARRRVSKGDFAKIFAVWDEYTAGNFARSRMLPLSQNSTYILSILHIALPDGP